MLAHTPRCSWQREEPESEPRTESKCHYYFVIAWWMLLFVALLFDSNAVRHREYVGESADEGESWAGPTWPLRPGNLLGVEKNFGRIF